MHKLNHSSMIVSIAAALIIFGASLMIGLKFDWMFGLLAGASAFAILVTVMLIYNAKQNQ